MEGLQLPLARGQHQLSPEAILNKKKKFVWEDPEDPASVVDGMLIKCYCARQ